MNLCAANQATLVLLATQVCLECFMAVARVLHSWGKLRCVALIKVWMSSNCAVQVSFANTARMEALHYTPPYASAISAAAYCKPLWLRRHLPFRFKLMLRKFCSLPMLFAMLPTKALALRSTECRP